MARYGRGYDHSYYGFAPYVPVEERRRQAGKRAAALAKKGRKLSPIRIEGRAIASTFWGKAWCENLEAYSDFSNRLPRGRTYARNGSVIDLKIGAGKVEALVSGSSIYAIEIAITPVARGAWEKISGECAGKVDSVVELLQGRLSQGVMEVMTRRSGGLFPTPREIKMKCSCPDHATMCKHVAATLYGVGARLDEKPELLFTLRKVDHMDLIGGAGAAPALLKSPAAPKDRALESADLSGIFGIDIEAGPVPVASDATPRRAKPGTKAPLDKKASMRRGAREATITAKDLVRRGVPHATIQNWLRAGVLAHTGERGTYRTTPETNPRIAAYLESSWPD